MLKTLIIEVLKGLAVQCGVRNKKISDILRLVDKNVFLSMFHREPVREDNHCLI